MEKYIIISIVVGLIVCRAVNDFFLDEDDDEPKLGKPLPGEVVQNLDESWTVNLNQAS